MRYDGDADQSTVLVILQISIAQCKNLFKGIEQRDQTDVTRKQQKLQVGHIQQPGALLHVMDHIYKSIRL